MFAKCNSLAEFTASINILEKVIFILSLVQVVNIVSAVSEYLIPCYSSSETGVNMCRRAVVYNYSFKDSILYLTGQCVNNAYLDIKNKFFW